MDKVIIRGMFSIEGDNVPKDVKQPLEYCTLIHNDDGWKLSEFSSYGCLAELVEELKQKLSKAKNINEINEELDRLSAKLRKVKDEVQDGN